MHALYASILRNKNTGDKQKEIVQTLILDFFPFSFCISFSDCSINNDFVLLLNTILKNKFAIKRRNHYLAKIYIYQLQSILSLLGVVHIAKVLTEITHCTRSSCTLFLFVP